MRRGYSTLILLAVFVTIGLYVYFVELERAPASETPPNESLVDMAPEDFTGLTITADGEETVLEQSDNGNEWRLTDPVTALADETQVSLITSALSTLQIQRVVAEEVVDFTPFGLDAPTVEVGFVASNGFPTERLLIGDSTPTGGERYAMLADSGRVVLVAAHLDTTFAKSSFDLRNKAILGFDTSDVDQLEIQSNATSIRLEKNQNEWTLQEPWDVRADFSTVQGLVGQLSSGQMRAVVSEGSSDEQAEETTVTDYGLSDPRLTATIRLGSATAILVVGNLAPDGMSYAKDASRPIVFTIDSTLVNDLERDVSEYRDKDLFDFRPFNASRLEIKQTATTTVFEKLEAENNESESSWMQVSPESTEADRTQMDDFLAKLSNLRGESFIETRDDVTFNENSLFLTARIRFNTGGPDEVSQEELVTLWRSGDMTYGIRGDEPGAAILDTRAVDDAIESLATLQNQES
jgi:hypothetical protein